MPRRAARWSGAARGAPGRQDHPCADAGQVDDVRPMRRRVQAHRGSWKNAKHAAQWEATLSDQEIRLIYAKFIAVDSSACHELVQASLNISAAWWPTPSGCRCGVAVALYLHHSSYTVIS